jgi:transposase
LTAADIDVCEARPPKRATRAGHGKSDEIDAIAAARTVLASDVGHLATPRADGVRSALRVLLVARQAMDSRRTADRNTLNALLRSFNLGIDARRPVTDAQLRTVSAWRARPTDDNATSAIRDEARRLATSIIDLGRQLDTNHTALTTHVTELAAELLTLRGVGPVTAAIILTVYSHNGRIRSEAAFANLAGVAPIPASSGNTARHRLNRYGDRQLNKALDVIARSRMTCDERTKEFVTRRTSQGSTPREIRRLLKRYIARQLFRHLNHIMP